MEYDVQRYDLDLTYDPNTDELSGTATIGARATQTVGVQPRFHRADGQFRRDRRCERSLDTRRAGTDDRANRRHQEQGGVHGGNRLPRRPELSPELGGSGFIHTDDGAVIVGEPHGAATWFPANDHPTDKASFTFHWTVPEGLEVVANGIPKGQQTDNGWRTWTWDAVDPMATYLATVSIGELDIHAYKAKGLPYWDAIDPVLFEPPPPPPTITPTDGEQMLLLRRSPIPPTSG